MTDFTDKLPSVFGIWLHPVRTRNMLQEAYTERMRCNTEQDAALQRVTELTQEVEYLKKERSRLQAANTETELKHIHLQQQYEAVNDSVDELRDMFARVEQMKRIYETRIQKYKNRIADLQTALKREAEAAANDIVPLPAAMPPRPVAPSKDKPIPLADKDEQPGDWYQPLDL